jgi:hypothetical protein
MEDLEHTLDLEEFIDASMRLYDTLKLPDKNTILSMKDKWSAHKQMHDEACTFHPNINKNSQRIASKIRPQNEPLPEALLKRKLETEARIEEMRRQKEESELQGCTFQPQIVTNSPYQAAYRRMDVWEEQEGSANKPNHNSFSLSTLKNSEMNTAVEGYENYDRYDAYD